MQLDVKIAGLTRKQVSESLSKAQIGVNFVLDKMAVMRDRPRFFFWNEKLLDSYLEKI